MNGDQSKEAKSGGSIRRDVMASVVVFLVALPLCMGVAIASGVPVAAGLFTGIVAGIVVGSLAGCPLQVSGPAAGLAVIVYDIVERFGLEKLGIIVLLAGVLQIAAGSLKLGQWFRAVSPAVIKGMLAGIGVLIFVTQFHVMLDDRPSGNVVEDIISMPSTLLKTFTQTGFAPEERRQFRSGHLKLVEELRNRQMDINDEVLKLLPKNEDQEPVGHASELQKTLEDNQPKLTELVAQQQEVAEATQKMNVIVREFEDPFVTDQSLQIVSAVNATDQKMEEVLEDLKQNDLLSAVQSQDGVIKAFDDYLSSLKSHGFAAQIGLLTIITIIAWPLVVPERLEVIPAPLVAIILATAVAAIFKLPVVFVDVPTSLIDEIRMPDWMQLTSIAWTTLLPSVFVLAAVASAETLLCATATDRMHTGPRTKYNKELIAQGVGNVTCGFIGALPVTGVIVRSTANIDAGGTSRLSAILHGVWLLLFVAVLTPVLTMIPVSALAAILVYIGYKLMDPKSVRDLAEFGRSEVAIYFATVITIVLVDLLTGIIVGIILAVIKLLYRFSRLKADLEIDEASQEAKLTLSGSATFLGLPSLATQLEEIPQDSKVTIRFGDLKSIDHACLDLLTSWAEQHESTGGQVVIDWDSLSEKYDEHAA